MEGFEPGVFGQMTLRLTLPAAHFPEAGAQLRKFLQEAYVPVNLRRVGAGYVFDIPEKARKKKVLLAGEVTQDETTFTARLVVGPKFDLMGYLRSFPGPERWREARAEVSELQI